MDDYYEKLYRHVIEQLCKEREQHEHEIVETIVKQVELQPLKPDSIYKVKFRYDITPYEMGKFLEKLNNMAKDKNIAFIPSCDYFEIVGETK